LQAREAGTGRTFTVSDTHGTTLADWNQTTDFTEYSDGVDATGNDLTTATGAVAALSAITLAIGEKDSYRAKLGYLMNRLDAAETVLNIQAENLMTAESQISDVDVSTEMANMTRTQVLAQAGIAMLAQANAMPQMAMTLLR